MKVGIVIPIFNRIHYLTRSLSSIERSDIPHGTVFVLVDDCSTDLYVSKVIEGFGEDKSFFEVIYMKENKGVRECLNQGIDKAFEHGCDLVINLDSDAVVKPNFIQRLTELHQQHDNIISGFNCISEQNPIISTKEGFVYKNYCNGINMCFSKQQYDKYIAPALDKVGNWDYNTSLACREDNKPFIITTPSLIQHIGVVSSMGHTNGGVQADIACDF